MANAKLFLDHFFFSLVSVFVAILVFSLIVGGIVPDFSLGDHLWTAAAAWIVLSCILASVLTYLSIRNRPAENINYTQRKY
ncbi:MAG: hypothetical protein RDU20_14420 [Desulfomonilaceae bacterium]|nr:hypothetical protein [Desulfomonilaceae bacterium]